MSLRFACLASLLLLVSLPSHADLATQVFYHSSPSNPKHPTYELALSDLKSLSSRHAQLILDERADRVTKNSIRDRYEMPIVPPNTDAWEYWYWGGGPLVIYTTEADRVAAAIARWEENSASNCGNVTWTPTTDWTAAGTPFGGVTRFENKFGEMTSHFYDESSATCYSSVHPYHIQRRRDVYCDSGSHQIPGKGCKDPLKGYVFRQQIQVCERRHGNPCGVSTGAKYVVEKDYEGPGIEFTRYYTSLATFDGTGTMGAGWSHSYTSQRLTGTPSYGTNYRGVLHADGTEELFAYLSQDSDYEYYGSDADSGRMLLRNRSTAFWELTEPNGDYSAYDHQGVLQYKETASGQRTTLTRDSEGRLEKITGPFGHEITLTYDVGGRVEKITLPDGEEIGYSYSTAVTSGRTLLSQATYQDLTVRDYLYEKTSQALDTFITGIIDENGDRYATYDYNADGYVTLSEHGFGQEKITLSYTPGSTTVTDSGGGSYVYVFETNSTLWRKPTTRTHAGQTETYTYPTSVWTDKRFRATEVENELGNRTGYSYDKYHTLTRTDAVGTPGERLTTYNYLSNKDSRKTLIRTPSVFAGAYRDVVTAYNTDDLPATVTTSGYRPDGTPVSRVVSMTYNANGQLHTYDGPRTDVTDVTTYEYYNCTTGNECGQLERVTNALGHITTYDAYDANGRLTESTDPNGLKVIITYDDRGRVLTSSQQPTSGPSRTTTYTYDGAGNVKTVSMPGGTFLTYDYDEAHQLERITDGLGNTIEYDYDARGNRTDEDVRDSTNALKRQVDTVYDLRNQIDFVNAAGYITDYTYDATGNLDSVTDPDLAQTTNTYDSVDRLVSTLDALSGTTTYAYDVNDELISVTAPNNAVTSYEYDDLGNLLREVSPDRGTTTYAHDAAGNVVSKTDARGKVTTYAYDALNRLTLETPDGAATIAYGYDFGTYALGRMNSVSDPGGATTWTYNQFGEVTGKTQSIGSVALTVGYGYDAGGNLTSVTLPSGKVIAYGYTNGLATSVDVDSTPVLSSAEYEPFGPPKSWTWGDSSVRSMAYDLRGLMSSHSVGADTRTLGYDNAGRLDTLDDLRHDLDFDYDALGHLVDFDALGAAPLSSQNFTYDANGNRLSFTEGTSYPYTVTPNSNRVATVAGPVAKTYSYDAAGNITGDGSTTFTYDDRGRMVTAGTATYLHNGLGQRVEKNNGSVTLFVYDEIGSLIGEYDASGNPVQEHIWFGGAPVAVISGAAVRYVHTDHLGTPRAITDSGSVIWRWESDPFGSTLAQEDPDGDLTTFTYNQRFPGQYYDAESGLHYNYFRTYDPSTGRYLESDPIGLEGGLNTYGYVGGNPLSYIDPLGLDIVTTSVSPNPNTTLATPVCINGKFGIKLFRRDPCIQDCAIKHEVFHIDRIRSRRPSICDNVSFAYFQYTGQDAKRLPDEEYSATFIELRCLEDKVEMSCMTTECERRVNERIVALKERLGWQ